MKTVRICLWSGPRNISTALMYSFAQREDTMVLDEPLYAHYLASSEKELVDRHPVAQVVLDTMENDGAKVVEMMMGEFPSSPLCLNKCITIITIRQVSMVLIG